jgi:circadian clock protein KaiC
LMVVKMRGGRHSKDIREYDISSDGIVVGKRLTDYVHLLTGIPEQVDASKLNKSRSEKSRKKL